MTLGKFFSSKDKEKTEGKKREDFLWTMNFLHSLVASETFILTPEDLRCTLCRTELRKRI